MVNRPGTGVRTGVLLEQLAQDVRYGMRMLSHRPGFTVAIVLTLALGIGANAAMFSLVNVVLFRPLPYPEPDRLVTVRQANPRDPRHPWYLSQADVALVRDSARTLERVAASMRIGCNVRGDGQAARYQAARVSAGFFDVLGVPPRLGRTLGPGDDLPGRAHLGILSFNEWQGRFGGDPGVLGRSLMVDGVPVEIVGVMPSGFAFPDKGVQLWISLTLNRELTYPHDVSGIGRLAAGVRPAEAQQETTQILGSIAGSDLKDDPAPRTVITPLQETMVGRSRTSLLILLGSVTLVLLIACANVTNMLLVRSMERGPEMTLRFALGATRGRVVRQLLCECLLLGALGSAAGLVVSAVALRALEVLHPDVPRLDELHLDGTVLAACAAAGLLATALFGLAPAWRLNRADASPTHRARVTRSVGNRRANGTFVVVQVALSLVLLAGTGLLLRSLQRLMAEDPGFDTRNLLALEFALPLRASIGDPVTSDSEPDEAFSLEAFAHGITESVRALPGIRSASLVSALPFTGFRDIRPTIADTDRPGGDDAGKETLVMRVSPGYFATLGILLQRGRDFEEKDRANSAPVAIVDEALARRDWPDGDPIGRRIRSSWDEDPNAWRTVVGVVATTRDHTLAGAPDALLYLPLAQEPARRLGLIARSEGDPRPLKEPIRQAVRRIDENIPGYGLRTMEEGIAFTASQQRFAGLLLSVFGGIALLLSAVGIHGVMSLEVTSRMKEFAIRSALGAPPLASLGLVIRQAARLLIAGIAIGIAGAFSTTRLLQGLLFEVNPADPATFTAVVTVLLVVALLAVTVPALRARRTDPAVSLRED
jgi:predicted permease